jgi:hypothetical protein
MPRKYAGFTQTRRSRQDNPPLPSLMHGPTERLSHRWNPCRGRGCRRSRRRIGSSGPRPRIWRKACRHFFFEKQPHAKYIFSVAVGADVNGLHLPRGFPLPDILWVRFVHRRRTGRPAEGNTGSTCVASAADGSATLRLGRRRSHR